jgi:integrase
MATVREVILPRDKRKDGTWNVKIRVYHNTETFYIKTQLYVSERQIRKDFTIKDPIALKNLNPVIDEYRTKIVELGPKLELLDVERLVKHLMGKTVKTADDINIVEFGRNRIEELKQAKRKASAANMATVVNSLIDYFQCDIVLASDIRTPMLAKYEAYLRRPRQIERLDQFKKPYKRTVQGLTDTGLHNHMRDLRILFNNIRDFYNNEDLEIIVVKHDPFKKYKIVKPNVKTKPKLTIEQVIAIRDFKAESGSRMELARDLFMLSFYLCGMNAVDLYQLPETEKPVARVDYNRSKTRTRRSDKAFISIHIPDVAVPLYIKYAGKLQLRYSSHNSLDRALSVGMRAIGTEINLDDLEFYDARHAFGDWARNICRFSKDDVGLALNHKDQTNTITDFYVSKSWAIIDELQAAVILLLEECGQKKDTFIEN